MEQHNTINLEKWVIDSKMRILVRPDFVKSGVRRIRRWGIVDMLGGGMMTTFIKQNKMGKAEQNLQQAKYALQKLQKELRDINTVADVHIEVGDFLRFADFFFDGFVADWLVQSRINDAKRQVNDAISKVRGILNQLSVY